MLRLGQERPELKIVSDQRGAPTASFEIAKAVWQILKDKQLPDKDGVYHMAPYGETNWFEFTQTIFDIASYQKEKFKMKSSFFKRAILIWKDNKKRKLSFL